MIITCDNSQEVDTARVSPEERHIIQKLMAWQSLSTSMAMFREKTKSALEAGWNNSGPVSRTRALSLVIAHLEKKVRSRLGKSGS
jgi:phage-related tail fiber protein